MQPSRRTVALFAVAASLIGTSIVAGADAVAAPEAGRAHLERVVVALHDQLVATPANRSGMTARAQRADTDQRAVLARLTGRHPTRVKNFALGNAFSATVTSAQAAALAADPAVASVAPDVHIRVSPRNTSTAGAGRGVATARPGTVPKVATQGPYAVCPSDPAKPLLEPEALRSIRARGVADSAQELDKGAGVKVAFIADGIDPDNPDFIRPDGKHVIVDYKDFSGDGPNAPSGGAEAFGDASSIAAQGTVSHDLSDFVNQAHPLPSGCNIKIVGVAPDAQVVALKAGGEFLFTSSILQSIDYAVRVDHVDVINESFGLSQFPDASARNILQLFNDQAVAAGVTVTESSGDGGVTGTIGSDAQDPDVISTGATTDNRLYEQTSYAAAGFSNGKWTSDNISALSSSGITQYGRTVDLVAPGEGNWAVCEAGFGNCFNFQSPPQPTDLQSFGGTSEAAPLTAGVAALVISAYRSTHGGSSPSPAVVKRIITGTATDLGLPAYEQGAGLLDARAATEAALSYRGRPSAPATGAAGSGTTGSLGSQVVTSTSQTTLFGHPGSTQTASVQVRNVGDEPVTVKPGVRGFAAQSSVVSRGQFDAATLPTFTYFNGATWASKEVHFDVPSGAARLASRLAWTGTRSGLSDAIVRLTLLAPDGSLVANSRPQGGPATANYANVDVRDPAAGEWTAVLYSLAGPNGYTGRYQLATDTQTAVSAGTARPASVRLLPGHAATVRASIPFPSSSSGDQDYSLTLHSSSGQRSAVSVIARPVIDTSSGTGRFSGVVTGGNARADTPAETFGYEFNVPKHQPDLSAAIAFADNPESTVDLVLIDPNGEIGDVVSNVVPTDDSGKHFSTRDAVQAFDADPLPGRWHLVVVVQNPVHGNALEQPFSGLIDFDGVRASAPGLPDSSSTVLPAGTPTTVQVAVRNPGANPIAIGVDPRTNQLVSLQPRPVMGVAQTPLPQDPALAPAYSIPPDTSALRVVSNSTVPAQLEIYNEGNGLDLAGDLTSAQNGDTISAAQISESDGYVTRGLWFTDVTEIGPFGDDGAQQGESSMTPSLRTLGFDQAVTSSTDDPYRNSVDSTGDGFGTPVIIKPGQTEDITVTITPTAATGTVVSGRLNLVTPPNLPAGTTGLPMTTTGEVVSTLAYRYTVG